MFFHNSVVLDSSLCKGCINCIKRCPTGAIRVRDGKAVITKEYCIDCGECIRICPHHAKQASFDPLDAVLASKRLNTVMPLKDTDSLMSGRKFKHLIAMPAPALYGQFNNLEDVGIVLKALLMLGFDQVFEVAAAAELVSELSREYISNHYKGKPFLSSACPSVVRLIRVRFPNLIEQLMPIVAPVDLAATLARKRAMAEYGYSAEEIGVVFISPCPAKVSAMHAPLGLESSPIDAVVAIKEIYPKLLPYMKLVSQNADSEGADLANVNPLAVEGTTSNCAPASGKIGVSWGATGGEAGGLLTDNYLAADGIENVIRVLEDLEDEKFSDLEFLELNACSGGCVGGVLTVENPFVAKVKLQRLRKYLPVARSHVKDTGGLSLEDVAYWDMPVEYEPVFKLGSSFKEAITLLHQVEVLCEEFPGLDCGSCGAPSCKALAEDIVRGNAKKTDCIHLMRQLFRNLSEDIRNF